MYKIRKTVVYKFVRQLCADTFVYRDSCVQELEKFAVNSSNNISHSLTRGTLV